MKALVGSIVLLEVQHAVNISIVIKHTAQYKLGMLYLLYYYHTNGELVMTI